MNTTHSSAQQKALELLSHREHSTWELRQKLLSRQFPLAEVEQALQTLQQNGLQSDERYAQALVDARRGRGYGPVRIEKELRQHQIDRTIIQQVLQQQDEEWLAQARQAREKRFGEALPTLPREKAKQAQFLYYRGFTGEQVRAALRD